MEKKSRYRAEQLDPNQYDLSRDQIEFIYEKGCKTLKERLVYIGFADTGIRREELAIAKIEKINFKEKEMEVTGKGGKTRIVPLSNRFIELITSFIGNREKGFLLRRLARDGSRKYLEKAISVFSLNKIMKRIGMAANFVHSKPGKKYLHPHMLRHSFSRYLLENNVPNNEVQAILGHDSIDTTIRTYGKPALRTIKKHYSHLLDGQSNSHQDIDALALRIAKLLREEKIN